MAQGDIKHSNLGSQDPQIIVFLQVCCTPPPSTHPPSSPPCHPLAPPPKLLWAVISLAVTLHRHPLYAPLQPPHILQQFSPAILIPPLIPSIVNIITIVSFFLSMNTILTPPMLRHQFSESQKEAVNKIEIGKLNLIDSAIKYFPSISIYYLEQHTLFLQCFT